MVLKPGREAEAEAIFRKWELDFAVIGRVTDTGHMVLEVEWRDRRRHPARPARRRGAALRPAHVSRDDDRPGPAKPLGDVPESTDIAADLLKLMASPDLASRRWIWEQYDQKVGADTVQPPGGDAAVVRVHGTDKALAITTDCTPRYCYADPYEGGKQAIAEACRNLSRGRRHAARGHRLHEFRQPAAARDHGPVRRLHRGHGRGLPRARLPDRDRQRLPLQRDQGDRRRQRDPAHPRDRRRRPDRGLAQGGRHRLQGGSGRRHRRDRRPARPSRPVALAARGCTAARTGRRRRSIWPPSARAGEFVRAAIAGGRDHRLPRRVGRRRSPSRSPRWRLPATSARMINDATAERSACRRCFAEDQGVYRRHRSATIACSPSLKRAHARRGRGRGDRPDRAASRLIFELPDGDHAVSLADLRAAHEGFFPKLMLGDSKAA